MSWPTQKLTFIGENADIPAKECSKCGEIKPLSNYAPDTRRTLGIQSHCRECVNKYQSNVRTKERVRNDNLRTLYKITLEDYTKIYNSQEGKCLICNKWFTQLVVDHCHDTKKVRGLLCTNCNIGIGNLQHDVQFLINAIKYLVTSK